MDFCVNRHSSDGHGTDSRTTIHRATCSSARKFVHGPKWRWFETWEEAHAYAQTTGHPVNCCGHCTPDAEPFASVAERLKAEASRIIQEELARFLGAGGRGGRSSGP